MSSLRRVSSASVDNISSRRFFSRITCWDFWGFDQRFGSAACFSISTNCWRSFPASKILPEVTYLILQPCIFLFEFFHHVASPKSVRDLLGCSRLKSYRRGPKDLAKIAKHRTIRCSLFSISEGSLTTLLIKLSHIDKQTSHPDAYRTS